MMTTQPDRRITMDTQPNSAAQLVSAWLSRNPVRMAAAIRTPVQCENFDCGHLFRPLDHIDQMQFIRCPACRKDVGRPLSGLAIDFTPRQYGVRGRTTCDGCSREADGVSATFRQNIGLVLLRLHREDWGSYCSQCLHAMFWKRTLITAAVGWIGMVSLLVAPFYILQNIYNYLLALPKAKPPLSSSSRRLSVELFRYLDNYRDDLKRLLESDSLADQMAVRRVAHSLGVLTDEMAFYLDWLAWEESLERVVAAGETVPDEVHIHLQETAYRLGGGQYPCSITKFAKSQDKKYFLSQFEMPVYQPDAGLIRRAA